MTKKKDNQLKKAAVCAELGELKILDEAAKLTRRSRSSFLITAGLIEARRVLSENDR